MDEIKELKKKIELLELKLKVKELEDSLGRYNIPCYPNIPYIGDNIDYTVSTSK